MANWKHRFSFPMFFQAVYSGNSPTFQYEIVGILIDGATHEKLMGASLTGRGHDMASKYIRGDKPIPKLKVKELKALPQEELARRIRETEIEDVDTAFQRLRGLFIFDHAELRGTAMDSIRESMEKEPLAFIRSAFLAAISCEQKDLVRLSEAETADILRIPDQAPSPSPTLSTPSIQEDTPADASPSAPSSIISDGSSPSSQGKEADFYSFRAIRLDYKTDEAFLLRMLHQFGPDCEYPISDQDANECVQNVRRSDVSYVLESRSSLADYTDCLIHRLHPETCSQLACAVTAPGQQALKKFRNALCEIFRYAATDYGELYFTAAVNDKISDDAFHIFTIYSLKDDQVEKRIQQLDFTKSRLLTPSRYRGRVSEFFLSGK